MTISTINKDLAFETFQYLPEKDLVECGKVNKQWKQMVEKNETELFSKDFLAIKGARDTFIRTRHLLEAVNKEIEALENFFADPENQVGLLEIGLSSFSFASEECASYRDKMQVRIDKNELLGKLKADSYRLSCINRVELLTIKNFGKHSVIMKPFGGREEFNKLPIIDIRHIQPEEKGEVLLALDFISPVDMENVDSKASIMRGFDNNSREFFTVKFKVVKDGKEVEGPYCATFYQRCSENEGNEIEDSENDVWAFTANNKQLFFNPKERSIQILRGKDCIFYDKKFVQYTSVCPTLKLANLISGMLINSGTREVFLLA